MPTPDHDPTAIAALNAVAHALEIDQTRAARHADNGYTWWIAPGLRQRVSVETRTPHGTRCLRIETPIWHHADPDAIAPLLEALCQHARGAAVLHAPESGIVSLVSRVPLPASATAARARALAGTGAIQAFLAAWAWGEARTQLAERAAPWRDALPHPELGMDVSPDPVLTYRDRVLRPGASERDGAFADALLSATTNAIERSGLGLMPQRHTDDGPIAFAVDVGPTLGYLEVGLINGAVDARSLGVVLTVPGHLIEARAQACGFELLLRQLAPDATDWVLGSWAPVPRRDGRPGFGINHGLFLPLALAPADIGPEIAAAAARTVETVRVWFEDGAPAPVAVPVNATETGRRVVA